MFRRARHYELGVFLPSDPCNDVAWKANLDAQGGATQVMARGEPPEVEPCCALVVVVVNRPGDPFTRPADDRCAH
jgi:hypothetical protein